MGVVATAGIVKAMTLVEERQSMFPEWNEAQIARARQAKADAIAQVEAHANPDWSQRAYRAVCQVAANRQQLTPDAVIGLLKHQGDWPPREPRALGPVMLRAVKAGVIRKTDRMVNSALPERHCRPVPVYLSLIYAGIAH